MQVKDIMTGGVIGISGDSSVRTAAQVMRDNDIGALPVDYEGVLQGIITDRDFAIRVIAEGHDPQKIAVGDVMTEALFTCYEDENVEEVVSLMKERKIRRVVVLNRQKQPVGVVSIGDIAAHADIKLTAEVLKEVAEPYVKS